MTPRRAAVATPVIPRWRVPKADGVAHLFPRKGPALCGIPNQEERYDRGPNRRSTCPTCERKAAAL